jgi:hypothetical protein
MNQVNKDPFKKTVHKLLMACTMSLLFCTELLAADIIQPKVYPSNNQTYALTVSPLKPSGLNGADYLLEKAGAPVWQKQQQKTAFMADVADSGESIYCSYSKGLEPPFDRDNPRDFGYMELSLLDDSGRLIWLQSIKRKTAMGFHKLPVPFCEQLLIHPQTSRAFYWYHQDQRTQLTTIDIKTGKSVVGIDFSLEQAKDLTAVESIKFHDITGSDLFLAEITGQVYEENETDDGFYGYLSDALFYLVDSKGHIYWQKHLLGSLDIRNRTNKFEEQTAYQQRDAYLKVNDLIEVNHEKQQFAITDYNAQQQHWFQISHKQPIKAIKTTALNLPTTPFETSVDNHSTPTLLQRIALSGKEADQQKPCNGNFDAIDVNSKGNLLLYHEDERTITRIRDAVSQQLLSVPKQWFKDDFIPHQLMFVGNTDQIFVNLGKAHYAVYDTEGNYLETQEWQTGCGEFCLIDFLMQKTTGRLWMESSEHQVQLAHLTGADLVPEITIEKGGQGRWFEYIYQMQTDHQGRLMMLGRTEDSFNHLYVIDSQGQPITTLNLGYGYSKAATVSNELAFISQAKSDEIVAMNFSGEVINKFQTHNHQTPYLLKAHQGTLYAITTDAVLAYDITSL